MTPYCADCGKAIDSTGGTFEFFYANRRAGAPKWSEPRTVCGQHKDARVSAGHTARVPGVQPDETVQSEDA